jgi:trimeric autotransporter adhesin
MGQASEALYELRPVTFRYNEEIDPARRQQFGLVAEDVEKLNPDLIVRDNEGKPYSVRYDQVNAMLLNEFLKEHKRVEELECKAAEQDGTITDLKSTVAKQEATIARQEARFAEQDSQIRALTSGLQRVSAQVAVSRPSPQVVKVP